ncbi:Uncharacterized [Syntrophomonas zehnderi OL-4]|uniref:Uncharacterized n=1 Tax=Syntrophomonas zehnderi OL-4 TaxID=690567 RepID=A0A0E3W2P6_9FIRM|nr:hypothetical protein [Syntrophomonas zehnderi]CFX12696.1 Uncharacterized [Syntrophomonas zehnderi OL-4]
MVKVLATILTVTGILIFLRIHIRAQKYLITLNRPKFDRITGITFIILGMLLFMSVYSITSSETLKNAINPKHLFYVTVGIILLTTIYTVITNYIGDKKIIKGDLNDYSGLSPGDKIQIIVESKRQDTYKFQYMYSFTLGLLSVLVIVAVITVLPDTISESEQLLILTVSLIALLVALKSMFFNEVNPASQWLSVLLELDKELASDEIDKIMLDKGYFYRNNLKVIGLGVLIGIAFLLIAVCL